MNKFNAYLTKKARHQKEALQKVKTQINVCDFSSFIFSPLPHSPSIKGKDQSNLLTERLKERNIKKSHYYHSANSEEMKRIFFSEKGKSKSYYDRRKSNKNKILQTKQR